MRNFKRLFFVTGIVLGAAAGCAVEPEGGDPEEIGTEGDIPTFQGKTAEEIVGADGGGKGTAELVSQWIGCGSVRGFPTWTFWGYTTAEAVNHTPGTRIRLSYQAGFGGTQILEVENFAQWGGRWAGATLWVTYLGYYESNGYYRNCYQDSQPPANAPNLLVQTY